MTEEKAIPVSPFHGKEISQAAGEIPPGPPFSKGGEGTPLEKAEVPNPDAADRYRALCEHMSRIAAAPPVGSRVPARPGRSRLMRVPPRPGRS